MKAILAAFTLMCVLAQQTFGTKQTEAATLNQDGSLLTDDGMIFDCDLSKMTEID